MVLTESSIDYHAYIQELGDGMSRERRHSRRAMKEEKSEKERVEGEKEG